MKGCSSIPEHDALQPGRFIDSDAPSITALAHDHHRDTPIATAQALYLFVRDAIRYDPYVDYTSPDTYRASAVLKSGAGYCVGKASLYTALCRASGIPAVLGLADVCNHLATSELLERIGTNVFHYHGFVLVKPTDRWLKVSPTFNATLCKKLGVDVLDFDGQNDALLQPHDHAGRQFMAYLEEHGLWQDVPFVPLLNEMKRLYPRITMAGGLRGASMDREASSHDSR